MAIFIIIMLVLIILFEFYCLKISKNAEELPKKVELTDEEKEKQESLRKNFENLMNYDYEIALKRK